MEFISGTFQGLTTLCSGWANVVKLTTVHGDVPCLLDYSQDPGDLLKAVNKIPGEKKRFVFRGEVVQGLFYVRDWAAFDHPEICLSHLQQG